MTIKEKEKQIIAFKKRLKELIKMKQDLQKGYTSPEGKALVKKCDFYIKKMMKDLKQSEEELKRAKSTGLYK